MIMKKIVVMFVALAATFSLAFAEPEAKYTTVNRHFNHQDFNRLAVGHSFQVDLTFADTYSIDLEVPDFIEPYLRVKNVAGKLTISLEKLPVDIQHKLNRSDAKLYAKVSMPSLIGLELSGSSRLSASGLLQLDTKNLDIDLSGASKLDELHAKGVDRLTIDASGASSCHLDVESVEMRADVSGSSHLKWDGVALRANIDGSGASHCRLEGNVAKMDIEASGASKVVSNGETEVASVEVSGASSCRISVSEKLTYELSGASTLRVKDQGASIRGECSRGSKVVFD